MEANFSAMSLNEAMKILFLGNNDGGLYNFRLELVERLLLEGHRVVLSSPYGERIEDLKALGCEYREISIERHGTNPLQELKLLAAYHKLLAEVRPDIVFTYTIKPNIYGGLVCRAKKIPYVMNITGLGMAVENSGPAQKLFILLYKCAAAKAQRVFLQNTENLALFKRYRIALDKLALLPGSGVNLERFAPMEYPAEDRVEFAFISRIMREKGADQYLEAAEIIRARHPETVFHVCGFCEQDYEERLRKLQERGVIRYHGVVKDVREVLRDIHCTVHPTYYPEGLSNVLLESAASARPIITTDRAGCREVVEDGVNGFVVRQRDSRDLVEKLERFIALPWEAKRQMGVAGRQKVEREFNRQIVVEKYLEEVYSNR